MRSQPSTRVRVARRGWVVIASILLATALGGGSVSAATVLKQTGHPGRWQVVDTSDHPLALCFLDTDGGVPVIGLDLYAPQMWARDKTAGVDHQKVGYLAQLQRYKGGKWVIVARNGFDKIKASDTTPGDYGASVIASAEMPGPLRVRLVMAWFGTDGRTIVGKVVTTIEWYAVDRGATQHDFCAS